MAIYEIVNPHDPYTLEADGLMTAAAAVVLLGMGHYALKDSDGTTVVPFFMFTGAEAWFQKQFGRSAADVIEAVDLLKLADCLDSVLIGDREEYNAMLALITEPEKRERFRRRWHEKQLSSCNDIGARAWKLAAAVRRKNAKN